MSLVRPKSSKDLATLVAPAAETRPDSNLNLRRDWRLTVDGEDHVVVVQYAMLSGFMSIELDGQRVARAWREWQTVAGGANLGAWIGDHALAARVTQAFGTQTYRFALGLDGEILPGSDALPTPTQVWRHSAAGLVGLGTAVAVISVIGRFPVIAAMSVGVGLAIVKLIYHDRLSHWLRAAAILSLIVVSVLAMRALAVGVYHV